MIERFRDHSANERTFLSWIRLAIGVMAFGFVIEKFEIYLGYLAHFTGQKTIALPSVYARAGGVAMMALAIVIIMVAIGRFIAGEKAIVEDRESVHRSVVAALVVAVLILVVLIFILAYVGHQVFVVTT